MGKLEGRLSGYTDGQLKTLKRSLTPWKHASWMNGFKVGKHLFNSHGWNDPWVDIAIAIGILLGILVAQFLTIQLI